MREKKKFARLSGLLYLIVIICGVFAEMFVRRKYVDFNNAQITLQNIQQHEFVFRLGFVSDLLMQTAFFLLPITLYKVLKDIHKDFARLMVLLVLVAVAIMCVNMLNNYAPLLLLSKRAYTNTIAISELQSRILFYMDMHKQGYHVAQLFFGLWLLPLGYLVFKSAFLPRIIGVLLIAGSFSFMIDFFIYFLFPDTYLKVAEYMTIPADVAEFSFCLYLLFIGVNEKNVQLTRSRISMQSLSNSA